MKRVIKQQPSLELALKHFGVKGMQWGLRKNKDAPNTSANDKELLTDEDKKARVKKVAMIAAGATIAARLIFVVGAMAAGTALHNRRTAESGLRALERSNILQSTVSKGVFKVTSL